MISTQLHLPRRHRRPLLFPPGLLALAWLLWLGCVALPQMRGMERPQVIMQLTMPPLNACLNSHMYGMTLSNYDGTSSQINPYNSPHCWSSGRIEKFRSWQTVLFTGNIFADYFSYQQAFKAAKFVGLSPVYDKGLRIQFSAYASYSSLIYSINLLNENHIIQWWLDTQQLPTTLYAFTTKPNPSRFGGDSDLILTQLPEPVLTVPLAEFLQPDWRNSTLLLLLMALLSAVRLGQRWRAG
ncbi:hypothetical protein [Hymenobacter canadensis]|uniref:Uncharacterized protein n=1 Tax=Hymenobacter canadensis TaxID=2999067 RepID=A0ABY7LS99_9BACT|nr:hypothetical protein [Hymenobacter canadensis]WBA42292.1 hypothetical protein O3303_01750 [Hymenobacter canadensis]